MAQYIDKSALVAEIDRLYKAHSGKYGRDEVGVNLEYIKDFLDTLEVKEMDLEKEYKEYVEEDIVYNKLVNSIVGKAIARHFFELGLKVQKGE